MTRHWRVSGWSDHDSWRGATNREELSNFTALPELAWVAPAATDGSSANASLARAVIAIGNDYGAPDRAVAVVGPGRMAGPTRPEDQVTR